MKPNKRVKQCGHSTRHTATKLFVGNSARKQFIFTEREEELMPHRVPRKSKRPKWNREPDYWLREKARLKLLESTRTNSDRFFETEHVCSGCDYRIWEAHRASEITRGCHCLTVISPPGHYLHTFDPDAWAVAVEVSEAYLRARQRRRGHGRN